MARKIRIECAMAAYHVMARGNQGRDIYAGDGDRKLWLATLGGVGEKTGWSIQRCWRGGCASPRRRVGGASERLGMGDESRVTQAIGRLKRKGPPELERLKRRLEQVYENHNGEAEVRI